MIFKKAISEDRVLNYIGKISTGPVIFWKLDL